MTGSPNGHGPPPSGPPGRPRSDLPSISLIIGVLSIPLVLLGVVGGLVAGCAAIVLGRRSLARVRRGTEDRRLAVGAIVTGSIGLTLSIGAGAYLLVDGSVTLVP